MNLSSNLISKNYVDKNIVTVNIDNEQINIPSFIVNKNFENIDAKSIYYALRFLGKFFEKKILIPNNLNYPISRKNLHNYFK